MSNFFATANKFIRSHDAGTQKILALMFVLIVWGITAGYHATSIPSKQIISAGDTQALSQSWLFQSAYSDLEVHDGEQARWLISQPKASYKIINHVIDESLSHHVYAITSHIAPPQFGSYSIRLATPATKTITITGASRSISFELQPGLRTYTLLIEQTFIPIQTRLYPISTMAFERYGFRTDKYTQTDHDARLLIADFRSATFVRWSSPTASLVLWMLLCIPLVGLVMTFQNNALFFDYAQMLIIILFPWFLAMGSGTHASIEPVLSVLICAGLIFIRRIARRIELSDDSNHTPLWVIAAFVSCFQGTRALVVSQWMMGVDFGAIPDGAAFLTYLTGMRVAFPIPLLSIEYILTQLHIPFLFDVLYATVFVRLCALVGIMAALSMLPRRHRGWRIAKYGLGFLLCLGVAFVYFYDDRNYWMVYDACIGLALVVVFLLFRTNLDRPVYWVLLSSAIVVADSLRPYMQLMLPALALVGAIRIGRTQGWRGLRWYFVPFTYSVVWHLHHIIGLGQWSWSNYAGFNIARAWMPNAYTLAMSGLPLDMNDPEWGLRSNNLVRESLTWIINNPNHAFRHALSLLWQMVSIPVTIRRFNGEGGTYEVLRTIPWYISGFRVAVGGVLALQVITFVLDIVRKPMHWQRYVFERAIWMTLIVLTALSETGEQSRFVAANIPLIFLGLTDLYQRFDWSALQRWWRNLLRNMFTTLH